MPRVRLLLSVFALLAAAATEYTTAQQQTALNAIASRIGGSCKAPTIKNGTETYSLSCGTNFTVKTSGYGNPKSVFDAICAILPETTFIFVGC